MFIAATSDTCPRAFDIEFGSELWHGELAGLSKATPLTYRLATDGRQYVVIAVGGGALLGHGASLVHSAGAVLRPP